MNQALRVRVEREMEAMDAAMRDGERSNAEAWAAMLATEPTAVFREKVKEVIAEAIAAGELASPLADERIAQTAVFAFSFGVGFAAATIRRADG